MSCSVLCFALLLRSKVIDLESVMCLLKDLAGKIPSQLQVVVLSQIWPSIRVNKQGDAMSQYID